MKLTFVLLTGECLQFDSHKDSCMIGRSSQCDVVITHEAMSRMHCLIEVKEGEIFVTDLNSSNGIWVEGKKIPPNSPIPYQTYFSLSFGAAQSLVISLDENQSIDAQTKPDLSFGSPSVKSNRSHFIKKTSLPKKKDEKDPMVLNLIALAVAILFLGYYFTQVRPL